MAPLRTPGRKRREADYSGVGQFGRKTGVTVPNLGPLDENGLEPVDNLFSSPQKGNSPTLANGHDISVDDMKLASSSQREPSDLLFSARQQPRRQLTSKLRSPPKTSLGSSPIRPSQSFTSPKRRADLSNENADVTFLPRHSLQNGHSSPGRNKGGSLPKKINDILGKTRLPNLANGRSSRSGKKRFDFMEDESDEDQPGAAYPVHDEDHPMLGDDESDSGPDEIPFAQGGGDLVNTADFEGPEPPELDNVSTESPQRFDKSHKRKSEDMEDMQQATIMPRRGRPAKKAKLAETSAEDGRQSTQEVKPGVKSSRQNKGKKGPAQRNVQARIKSVKSESSPKFDPSTTAGTTHAKSKRSNNVKPRRTNITAAEQVDGVHVTAPVAVPVILKSGRTTMKPLEWWRGEQIVYQPPKRLGKELLPGGYSSINPGRKATQIPPKATKRRAAKRPGRFKSPEEEEIDEDQEDWEREGPTPGVLNAGVFIWDPETQNPVKDAHEEIELALAPLALDEKTQWAKGHTFKFGKTLTLPFFHSGIVDLPPGGEKRPKNSRKNHMIFWVFSGRVQVDVSGNIFSVGRGGMWQVPRGNSYRISNPFDREVRIFFAQGSYMEQPEDEAALMAGAAPVE